MSDAVKRWRERKRKAGLKEVRHIWLPDYLHSELKDYAAKLLEAHENQKVESDD